MVRSIASALLRAAPKIILASLMTAAITWSAPGFAQDTRIESLVNRLDRMERDMGTLSRQVYGGAAPKGGAAPAAPGGSIPSGDYAVRLEQRLNDLEGQMTRMTGTIETLMHSNSELSAQVERMSKDYEARFKDLEGRGGAGGPTAALSPQEDSPTRGSAPANIGTLSPRDLSAAPKGEPAPQQRASLPAGSPQQQYDYAYGLLDKARTEADYSNAARAFQDFLAKNPSGPLASAARYWMGQSYFVNKDYQTAASIFLEGYQKDQKGQKAPDTLLKLGMSLTRLDKKREACATFDKLSKDFPSAANGFKNLPGERKRAGCA
jgi:tol-pal system protein YbgF